MGPEGSLPCSQEPSTGPYTESKISPICTIPSSLRFILILSTRLSLNTVKKTENDISIILKNKALQFVDEKAIF
jgi:hypothetical protein